MRAGVAIAGVPIPLRAASCSQGRERPIRVPHVDGQLSTRPADPGHQGRSLLSASCACVRACVCASAATGYVRRMAAWFGKLALCSRAPDLPCACWTAWQAAS